MNKTDQVTELYHREQIKELRYRYCHALDQKDFDGVEACFLEKIDVDFGAAGYFSERDELIKSLKQFAESNPLVGMHQMSNPVFEHLDVLTAKVRWVSNFTGYDPETLKVTRQMGFVSDEYEKLESGWRIKACQYQLVLLES